VLVVDDDEIVARAHARILGRAGYDVSTAIDGAEAIRAVETNDFDAILTDIDMPGMNGLALLEQIRAHDLDVPVVMVTGTPTVGTATRAMEHGALRYLTKPVDPDEMVKVAGLAVRLNRVARAKREALELAGGVDRLVADRAGLTASFERALASIWIAYQPIVSWSTRTIYAYEALLRSNEPSLPHPGAIIDAAERLGRVRDLGRAIRARAIEPLDRLPSDVSLFVNLHPTDLLDDDLFATSGPLAAVAPRIVLEITERASLHGLSDVPGRVRTLRDRGFRIAIDDLGQGYAGLTSFALLDPEVVKLDLDLVRDIHRKKTKQTLVKTMISMCHDLRITITSEGIEHVEERDELAACGCDLMQGYLFAKPAPAFTTPQF
jgi:EAL domain-containing protein (putative c-di-GMP-specific phosphodiesterase class I)/CheY-like chemotaxis protein